MAHLFKQMYVDEVDFQETLSYDQLIGLVFTEFVHRQMQQLEELETACVKTEVVYSSWTAMREHCEITDEDDRWLTYADKAISMVDRDDIWRGILEAFKILKYPIPSSDCKCYFLTLFNLSWLAWSRMYCETERTTDINNLMDYVICVCKLKYQPKL